MDRPTRPYATCFIALVLLAAFGLQAYDPSLLNRFALVGNEVQAEPVRFFTGAFLHGDLTHFIMNVASLLFLGSVVETALGRVSLLVVYSAALVGGQAAVLMWTDPSVATVGASGAIYGLFGAAVVANMATKSWRALFSSVGIILVNAVVSFTNPGISWQAHLGGLVAGFIVAVPCAFIIVAWSRRRARKEAEVADRVGYYPQQQYRGY